VVVVCQEARCWCGVVWAEISGCVPVASGLSDYVWVAGRTPKVDLEIGTCSQGFPGLRFSRGQLGSWGATTPSALRRCAALHLRLQISTPKLATENTKRLQLICLNGKKEEGETNFVIKFFHMFVVCFANICCICCSTVWTWHVSEVLMMSF
jgi:hypothetical protein